MYVKEVTVENQVGLHARPATFFIQKANEFKSSIWVEKEERRVQSNSVPFVYERRGSSLPLFWYFASEQREAFP